MSGLYFTGLGSGIDTDAMVTYLIERERLPLFRAAAQKKELQARESCWQEIRSRLVALEQSLRELQRTSLYQQKTAAVDREGLLEVSASSTAATGSCRVEIISLAQAHSVASSTVAEITGNESADLESALGLSGSLRINETEIMVFESSSFLDICVQINAQEELEVTAAIIDRRLVLTRNETGAAEISIEDNGLGRALGLLVEEEPGSGRYFVRTIQEAREANLKLNGLAVTRSSNIIDDLLEGVSFRLLQAGEKPLTVTVADDRASLINRLEEFIRHYNSAYQFIKMQTAVDPEGGTKGTLYGESSLNQVLASIRRTVTGMAGSAGEYNCLAAIGIGTVKWGSADPEGTLSLERNKFLEALEAEPAAVTALLSGEQGAAARLENYLISLTCRGEGLIHYRSEGTKNQIRDLDRRMAALELRLEKREQTLRQQFLAAERIIAQMNSQEQWLEQQFSLMTPWTTSNRSR